MSLSVSMVGTVVSAGSPGSVARSHCRPAVVMAVVADSVIVLIHERIADTIVVSIIITMIVTDSVTVLVHEGMIAADSVTVRIHEAFPEIASADAADLVSVMRHDCQ